MEMEFPLLVLKASRRNFASLLEGLSLQQMLAIPDGFGNNILWNAGHSLVSQQLLCYACAGLPLRIPQHYVDLFRKGTSPEAWKDKEIPQPEELRRLLVQTVPILEADLQVGLFQTYKPYRTSFGVELHNADEAVAFATVHEAIHYGVALSLRKLVS